MCGLAGCSIWLVAVAECYAMWVLIPQLICECIAAGPKRALRHCLLLCGVAQCVAYAVLWLRTTEESVCVLVGMLVAGSFSAKLHSHSWHGSCHGLCS